MSEPFTWIEANVPQSMHGCSAGCGKTQAARLHMGDNWASSVLPALTSTAGYQNGSTVIFVVWDQGWGNDNSTPLIVLSPYVTPGTTDGTAFTHYSLLRGTEEYLHLPLLDHAGDSGTASVAGHFGLPAA